MNGPNDQHVEPLKLIGNQHSTILPTVIILPNSSSCSLVANAFHHSSNCHSFFQILLRSEELLALADNINEARRSRQTHSHPKLRNTEIGRSAQEVVSARRNSGQPGTLQIPHLVEQASLHPVLRDTTLPGTKSPYLRPDLHSLVVQCNLGPRVMEAESSFRSLSLEVSCIRAACGVLPAARRRTRAPKLRFKLIVLTIDASGACTGPAARSCASRSRWLGRWSMTCSAKLTA